MRLCGVRLPRFEYETRNDPPTSSTKFWRAGKWSGFGLLEIVVAIGLWIILVSSGSVMLVGGLKSNRLADETAAANNIAAEGIDGVKAIKKQGWTIPFLATSCTSGCGIATVSGTWGFLGTNNVIGKYTRQVFVNPVNRDVSGNIVASGGTLDTDTYKATSIVTWSPGGVRSAVISAYTYLTNYAKAIATGRGGMIVYGDGDVTTDAIKYKTLSTSGVWSSSVGAADVDVATTNKYLRAVRLYASATRNEKVMVSRHYNGTAQWIYAQVWNGTTWGNVVQLSTWTATTFLDVQNFSGTYLANGDFMVVYSDNTTTPKSRVWNGTTWAAQTSMNVLLGIPLHIKIANRPGTNEVMVAFLDSANDTNTEYNNGAGYALANWTVATSHAVNTVLNTKRIVDFDWSLNNSLVGVLTYASTTTEKTIRGRAFLANGTGGGAWGTAVAAAAQTNNMGAIQMVPRPGVSEFDVCNKDAAATPTIVCRKLTFASNVVTWVTPTNPVVGATSDTGIQRSFDVGFEQTSGTPAVNLYGDNTTTLKYKTFNAATATWDVAATSLMTFASVVRTTRIVPKPGSDDFMMLTGSTNLDFFTLGWNGTAGTIYGHLLGNTSTQTGLETNSVGTAEAFPFTANSSSVATEMMLYVNSTNTAPTIHVGIYSDNASNPGTLLSTASFTPVNGAWNSITIPTAALIGGIKYWIAALGITSGNTILRDLGTGCVAGTTSQHSSSSTLTSLPTTWVTGGTAITCLLSAYVPIDGNTFHVQATNGSAITDYWYDFVWDGF